MRLPRLGACTVAEGDDQCTALGSASEAAQAPSDQGLRTRPGLRGREGALVGLAPNK